MTSTEEVLAAIDPPTRPPALHIDERDAILYAATAHAAACRAHQKWTDTGVDEAGAAAVNTTLERLRELLNQATTTQVDQQLLERTLERDKMTEARNAAQRTVTSLRMDLDMRTRERDNALYTTAQELERFKDQVVEVASRYADEHNMCNVVDRALEELGLARKGRRYRATLNVRIVFEATVEAGNRSQINPTWVRDSIGSSFEDAIRGDFEMDSDHEDSDINDISFSVTNVQEI